MSLVCGQNSMRDNRDVAASFAEFVWDLSGTSHVTAAFEIDSFKVRVSFEQRESGRAWYVAFEVGKGDATEAVQLAFAIFDGVFQAINEFVGVREPEILIFATERDELAGVYRTCLRKESAQLKELGYEIEGLVLRRVKSSSWANS